MKTLAERNREKSRRYYWRHREVVRARQRQERLNNPKAVRARDKRARLRNREAVLEATREWRRKNPESGKLKVREWRKLHPGHNKQRYRTEPAYRLKVVLRARLGVVLRGLKTKKVASTFEMLGCSSEHLKVFLQSKFKPGMTWSNHGRVWHLDHVKPCAKFDLTDPVQQRACFHFSNLQPLFVRENLQKSNNYPL